jgi:hypothetical protein
MGYTTTGICHEDINLPQTPENVKAVRVRAGWTVSEAASETKLPCLQLVRAEEGHNILTDHQWKHYLTVCGKRQFDHE